MNNDEILTAEEVGAFIKIKPRSVRYLAKSNKLKGTKILRAWRFKKSERMALFEKKEAQTEKKERN